VDSMRKLLFGRLHEAVALLLLLAIGLGCASLVSHKWLTRLYGATAARLLSNFQAVSTWMLAVAIFYASRADPLLHGIGCLPDGPLSPPVSPPS
jgi:formate hydrogenlyase subunit 3/multisubunit Na+/H+ antiporter MnhD subunit